LFLRSRFKIFTSDVYVGNKLFISFHPQVLKFSSTWSCHQFGVLCSETRIPNNKTFLSSMPCTTTPLPLSRITPYHIAGSQSISLAEHYANWAKTIWWIAVFFCTTQKSCNCVSHCVRRSEDWIQFWLYSNANHRKCVPDL
jgi:hypothetical protein